MKNTYAIITGASSGIGTELASLLAHRGYNLVLAARSEDKLQSIAATMQSTYGIKVEVCAVDLANAAGPHTLAKFCADKQLAVEILVNNAGYGVWGAFEKCSLEAQQEMLRLNNETLMSLCYLFYPMLRQQKGYILNVASTAAFQAVPKMAAYAATKSFVLSLSRALYHEWKGEVSVTALCPGPTKTGFVARAGMNDAIDKLFQKMGMEANDVARLGVHAMFKRKPEVIAGFSNKMGVWLGNVLPKSAVEAVAAMLFKG